MLSNQDKEDFNNKETYPSFCSRTAPLVIKKEGNCLEEKEEVLYINEVNCKLPRLNDKEIRILLKHVVVGCKLWVHKSSRPDEPDNDAEQRLAEVLLIRNSDQGDKLEFYLHYCGFNKRLDEWVHFSKLDITKPILYPKGVKSPPGGIEGDLTIFYDGQVSPPGNQTSSRPNKKPKTGLNTSRKQNNTLNGSYWDTGEEENASKKLEIEKLRTSCSMTQNSHILSRVKNINRIQIGRYEVDPWYFSPYPPEFAAYPIIYLCESCLRGFHQQLSFKRHRLKCRLYHPPGKEIYRRNDISFFEVDGRVQKMYCRWLGLLSKLFLDHKTLYYDMDPFLFYVMTKNDESGCHILGYFSKEKESAQNYNLACILTLPQYQRLGYGRMLIQFSYELSKIEKKMGSPEKPLSDLGLLSYRAYWLDAILAYLIPLKGKSHNVSISIDQISEATAIISSDVIHTLSAVGILKYYHSDFVIHLSDTIIEKHEASLKKHPNAIDPKFINWTPDIYCQSSSCYVP